MRLLLAFLTVTMTAAAAEPPQLLYGPLYRAVAEAGIFEDSKNFADAVPKSSPRQIISDYAKSRPRAPAELKAFVAAHFDLPEAAITQAATEQDRRPLIQHIDGLWPQLVRRKPTAPPNSSLIALPHPYVVPGGRFREIYYWDSYFTMLGLAESGRHQLVTDMVRNFAHLIDRYGHIPNGNRSYYLSRSQPPFFFAMAALTSPNDPSKAYAQFLPELKAEYRYWMQGTRGLPPGSARARVVRLADGAILNRYWDNLALPRDEAFREDALAANATRRPAGDVYRDIRAAAESGWDFSARWLADDKSFSSIATTQIVPVDLNSLLFGLENAIKDGCVRAKQNDCIRVFTAHAAKRKAAINHYLWNHTRGAYLDYRWQAQQASGVLSAATLYPLFAGLADRQQVTAVAATTREHLLKAGGLATTTVEIGQQWDAPNGWAPLQWIAVSGLNRHGENRLAGAIACRWIVNVNAVYRKSGKLVEKYDVVSLNRPGGGGEYKLQDGFGWTNGVTRKLLSLYPAAARYGSVQQCTAP